MIFTKKGVIKPPGDINKVTPHSKNPFKTNRGALRALISRWSIHHEPLRKYITRSYSKDSVKQSMLNYIPIYPKK